MLTIGRLENAAEAADYYLSLQANCEQVPDVGYYTGAGEPRGVWCGSAGRALAAAPLLDQGGESVEIFFIGDRSSCS